MSCYKKHIHTFNEQRCKWKEKILYATADLLSRYKYFMNSVSQKKKKGAMTYYLSSYCSPRSHTKNQGE